MKTMLKTCVMVFLMLYGWSVMGVASYYNWTYANEKGFKQWLLLGQIVPTAKAVVWPYFVFVPSSSVQHSNSSQFEKSIANFREKILPQKYPKLLTHLASNKTLDVSWISFSNERRNLKILEDSAKRIVFETDTYINYSEQDTSHLFHVTMIDENRDANIDIKKKWHRKNEQAVKWKNLDHS